MEFPGVARDRIEALEPDVQQTVRHHIKELEAIIGEKELLLKNKDPNEKFLGFQGFQQIEKYADSFKGRGELSGDLSSLRNEVMKLRSLIDREIALVKDIKRLTETADKTDEIAEELERIKAEIEDDLVVGMLLRDQLFTIDSIHILVSRISKQAPDEVREYVAELDDICSMMKEVIQREIEKLDLIYNVVNIPGWRDVYGAIQQKYTST